MKRKTAKRFGDGDKDKVQKVETQEMRILVVEEKAKVGMKKMKTENIEERRAERTKEGGPEDCEEMEWEMKEEESVDTSLTGFDAAEPEIGTAVQVLKPAMKKSCFIPSTSFGNLEEEYKLEAGSVLTEKVKRFLFDSSFNTRSALGRSYYTSDMFFKRDVENVISLMNTFYDF